MPGVEPSACSRSVLCGVTRQPSPPWNWCLYSPATGRARMLRSSTSLRSSRVAVPSPAASLRRTSRLPRARSCTRLAGSNLIERNGGAVGSPDALYSRAGRYINGLRRAGQISGFSEQIAKLTVHLKPREGGESREACAAGQVSASSSTAGRNHGSRAQMRSLKG